MSEKKKYLTIHGHFYQPPRENPWLEAIELQESALPFHDWNARISNECYNPNSVSRIVDSENRIIDIVNNYSLMSFNFGPTLMSWLESNAPLTYERILEADKESQQKFSGHGNAIAQVYNHMIMPLANLKDKYTQTRWGIRDFEYRFQRKPEGIWLAETAVDDETLEVLVDCGIKYTILSPYQAAKVRSLDNSQDWSDVSWGNIDPARPYRYYLKNNPDKYIDLFFYDGAISRSVAFDNLLKDGEKFIKRIQDGVSSQRDYNQLVNIGTDGESYGHHTRFGDMALSYILKVKAEQAGLIITNYAQFLEEYPPEYEVDIKQASSWSCCHGVGRWKEDCGCSTGGHAGWNQKWRKPLRDELIQIYESVAPKYLKEPWEARDDYINVILDRSEDSLEKFFAKHQVYVLSLDEKTAALRLLEIQRQAMLMYTSCGWFFSEISGIETTQIMKYAARAIELALNFSDKDLETPFLEILSEAKSNIKEFKTGKDVYEKFVKPSVIHRKQIVTQWALKSLYEEPEEEEQMYCYTTHKIDYRQIKKGNTALAVGRVKVRSQVTLSVQDFMFAILRFSGGDFHCTVREFTSQAKYNQVKSDLVEKYWSAPLTEVIRKLDECFERDYFTLENMFIEERRHLLGTHLKNKVSKFSNTFRSMYEESRGPVLQLSELGVEIPAELRIVAKYTLSKDFNNIFIRCKDSEFCESILNEEICSWASEINSEAEKLKIKLDKRPTCEMFEEKLLLSLKTLIKEFDYEHSKLSVDVLTKIQNLNLDANLNESQNLYFKHVFGKLPELVDKSCSSKDTGLRQFAKNLISIGKGLHINVEKFELKL